MSRRTAFVLSAVIAAGVALRLHSGSALWLDEALTVDIARGPLRDLPDALRHDGSPPLYYALLHLWMQVFGDGDVAVRSLSTVFSVAALPVAYLAGLRVTRDKQAAWFAVVLLAASPFAVRYATEARMYSLVVLLTALALVARRPVALAAVAAALVLTHYWAAFLVLAAVALLRGRKAFAILAGAGVAALAWSPVLLYQVEHTGTPWAAAPGLHVAVDAVFEFAGGRSQSGAFLALLLLALAVVGVWGRTAGPGAIELRTPGERRTGALAALGLGGLFVGVLASVLLRSGFAPRYAAIALVPFLVVVAAGVRKLPTPRAQLVVLGLCVVLGLTAGIRQVRTPRTQARMVADVVLAEAGQADVVAYCPDQLGPAGSRAMERGFAPPEQVTYPAFGRPERVDWVDYAERNRAAEPEAFAHELLRRAGSRTVWLVWANGYRTFSDDCSRLRDALFEARPETRHVRRMARYFERMMLTSYPAP